MYEHGPLVPVKKPYSVAYVAVSVPKVQSHQEWGTVKPRVAEARLQVTGVGVIAFVVLGTVVYKQSSSPEGEGLSF